MKAILNSDSLLVLAPFQLSEQGEVLLQAVRHEYMVSHYASIWGGIVEIKIAVVLRTDRPVLHIKALGKNGGRIELYYSVHNEDGNITLMEYDLPNVQQGSLDPEMRRLAGPPC